MSEEVFTRLDPDLPLTLLPVRLEARYLPRFPREPTHLAVRIFPDVIHADGHKPDLTNTELTIGRQYWISVWGETEAGAITEARRWLAAQTGPHRALWVSTAARPTNLDSGEPKPVFDEVLPNDDVEPVVARLLPDQWMVRAYDSDLALAYTTFSNSVRSDLPMAPKLSGTAPLPSHPLTGRKLSPPEAFLGGQELLWAIDFDMAVAVGMAVKIPVAKLPDPIGALLVLGVRPDRPPLDEGTELDSLLEAHWYTRGLDLVPQGTPTNNSDAGRSQVSLSDPDIDELFEREASERPIAPAGRGVLVALDPALLYRIPSADSTSLALGRLRANVLDRTVHAVWGEGAASWAMNVTIGYAVFGRYLSGPLGRHDGSVITEGLTDVLRQWYVDWVRGAGPLPLLRAGEQPYGVLPVTTRPAINYGALTFEDKLEHLLAEMIEVAKTALPVPAMDPDATDSYPSGSSELDALTVGKVLGAVPHPTGLRVRRATNHLVADMNRFDELITQLELYIEQDRELAEDYPPAPVESLIWRYWWESRKQYVAGRPDLDPPITVSDSGTQTFNLEMYRQEVQYADDLVNENGPADPGYYPTEARRILPLIDDELLPLLSMHRDANNAAPSQLWDWIGAGLGSDEVVRLVATTYDADTDPIVDLVVTGNGTDPTETRDYIELAIEILDDAVAAGTPPSDRRSLVKTDAPLLAHLLDVAVRTVPVEEIGPVRLGLATLLAMIDYPTVDDPVGELERLMRETLGLAMYRLDAWITSRAAERLARKRQFGYGTQIGGYGWLLDLSPSDDPTSQGFIHAHSMTHAATAAVLRSGWSAYGTESGETPLSVDLSSGRVRGGQWILDGVRNGQDLAELLGARFERYLHEVERDEWIETVRRAALEVAGSSDPPTAVVDGLLVARAGSDVDQTDREALLENLLRAALSAAPNDEAADVGSALKTIAADLDSVADLAMTQSVHSILQGNADAAAAMMSVTGGGDGAVPPVTVTATQRESLLVSHRVMAVWGADFDGVEQRSIAHATEPRLVSWLDGELPRPSRVIAEVIVRDAEGTVVQTEALAIDALGLGAYEAAVLAGTGASQARSRLGRVVGTLAEMKVQQQGDSEVDQTVEVDLTAPTVLADGQISVDEFGLIAAALVDALGRSRALRGADLVARGADPGPPSVDLVELQSRVDAVEQLIDAMVARLGRDEQRVRIQALIDAAVLGVPGSVAALEAGSPADAAADVAAAMERRSAPVPDGEVPADPVEAAVERLVSLTGSVVPILPVFTPPADPDRARSAASTRRRRQVLADGHRWLRQVGRVRADLGAMTDWLLLSETTLGRPVGSYGLAQLPESGDGWAAVGRPDGSGDRLCLFSLTGAGPLAPTDDIDDGTAPIAGLLIDSWTEGIPRPDQQTGVAVHFDAPTARAPQAVLLSVVEDDPGFDADGLCDQLLHTIELAKLRVVGPGEVEGYGHYVPSVFLPDDATFGEPS